MQKQNEGLNKVVVIIPTYNEAGNIEVCITKIRNILANISILVVDDNSTDGTQQIVEKVNKKFGNVELLKRKEKEGLCKAYLAGFSWAFQHQFQVIVQMDADLSHRPEDLKRILDTLFTEKADLVVGSRYIRGGGVVNWSFPRRKISRFGNYYANFFLKTPISDLTGGFNAWDAKLLKKIVSLPVESEGYGFQIEMKYKALLKGAKILECPILFVERASGQSKMSKKIVFEAMKKVPQMKKSCVDSAN